MKFIEINDTISVNLEKIIAIESTGQFTSRIKTEFSSFEANFPKSVLVDIIERELDNSPDLKEEVFKRANDFFKQAGHFAG